MLLKRDMEKTWNYNEVEKRLYTEWESRDSFVASGVGESYTIMMPPPNVTGVLHMGHALTFTLQDLLVRYKRMRGYDTLYMPGVDHAGIATQIVVEKQLLLEGKTKHDLGRDKFLERVWNWKESSGDKIVEQQKRLGLSADWSKSRFTMDDGSSKAVERVFIDLYNQGLIYRAKRLVNWDPKLKTAISDLEVEMVEVQGKLWYIEYPLVEGSGTITVATTRPETMLGDVAVAVNPKDERYVDLIGKYVELPLSGREIPIIEDEHADMSKGSGAVKITPGHDFNDFEVGKRNNLEAINILNDDGSLNKLVPSRYEGLSREKARDLILSDLEELGLLQKEEENLMSIPYGDRSGEVIEPMLTEQWYVDVKGLAKRALEVVKDGRTKFIPKNWERTYYNWLENIEPWCISRQLWWGHRIPAYFSEDGDIFVASSEEEAYDLLYSKLGRRDIKLKRDEDVLDTWFSSGLWPFSTLGYPEDSEMISRYYPSDCLVTGFDIIFFWVARMMMMGLHFMNEVPFKEIYIHALVRDEYGKKMSKSKGNVIDPLTMIDKYGADALRFTMISMSAQGRDIKLSESRIEGYRNFSTKLWNAARFCLLQGIYLDDNYNPLENKHPLNRWIVSQLVKLEKEVSSSLDEYRFNDMALSQYHFVWGTFCDWYLELVKPILWGDNDEEKSEVLQTLYWVLKNILHYLHPFMPYVSEELYRNIFAKDENDYLITGNWSSYSDNYIDEESELSIKWLIEVITEIRSARSELNINPKVLTPLIIRSNDSIVLNRILYFKELIIKLSRLKSIDIISNDYEDSDLQSSSIRVVIDSSTLYIKVSGVVDFKLELERLEKEYEKILVEYKKLSFQLENEKFISNAPKDIVSKVSSEFEDIKVKLEKTEENINLVKSFM